jgi:hypothetical protein
VSDLGKQIEDMLRDDFLRAVKHRGGRPPHIVPLIDPELIVHKVSGYIPVTREMLDDYTGTGGPRAPLSRGLRFRYWRERTRERIGVWVGSKLAGIELHTRDDCDSDY